MAGVEGFGGSLKEVRFLSGFLIRELVLVHLFVGAFISAAGRDDGGSGGDGRGAFVAPGGI